VAQRDTPSLRNVKADQILAVRESGN
jgi:hypothetical protein